jgi:segregation and condensation protein A
MYKIKTEKFEGPLDLLLRLIEDQKFDISEISLAQVTDQYVERLKEIRNPGELADFLVVAAKLLWIKSKILLPSLDLGGEEECDLESQLKIYKEYLEASFKIHKMILGKNFAFVHERLPVQKNDVIFNPPKWLNKSKLAEVLKKFLINLEPIIVLPKAVLEKTISIQESIAKIKDLIQKRLEISFGSVIKNAKNKIEIIVNFLALLELVKQKTIAVNQNKMFGDINIQKKE